MIALTLSVFSACVSQSVRVKDLNRPLKMLQSSIFTALPNGNPKIDSTKRKFISKPFLAKAGLFIPVSNSRIHYVSHIEILGDRRPYTIYIESFKMVRNAKRFVVTGQDKSISEQVAKAIQYELSKRLKNTDIIDDFRAF